MSITISLYVESVNDEIDAGYTQLKLYRDTVPDGAFSTLVDTVTLVADTLDYSVTDSSGTAASWYRYGFYNPSTLTLTTLSDPSRPDVTTLLDVIAEAAKLADAGFTSVVSGTSTTTELVDEVLLDHGEDSKYQEAAWVYLPAAAAADQLRRIKKDGFNTANGGLQPVRAWSTEPVADDVYHLYLLIPPFSYAGAPYSWADAARDGLSYCEYVDQVDLGVGTSDRDTRFSLGTHLGYIRRENVREVIIRTFDSNDVPTDKDASKNGRYWEAVENGRGELSLDIFPAPLSTEHVIVEINRRDAEIYAADDITGCPLRLAARATVWKVYEHLNEVQPGRYKAELVSAYGRFIQEYRGQVPENVVAS